MAAHAPGEHPEAEQLNAFAENALAAQERESVLAHLAACEDCREIVGLAVEARPEGAPLVKPARDGFRWATFQWAAVAASVAIVTVAVLVVGPKETREPQRATETVAIERQQPESQPAAKVPETPLADLKVGRAVGSKSDASVKPKEAEKKLNGGIGAGSGAGVGIGSGISGGGFGGGVYKVEETTNADAVTKLQQKKEAGPVEPAAKPAPSRGLAYSVPASSANDTFYSSTPVNRPAGGSVQGGIAQNVPPPPVVDGGRARTEEQGKSSNEISKDKRRDSVAQASNESVEVSAQAATIAPAPAPPVSIKTKSSGADMGVLTRTYASTLRLWRVRSGKIESSDDSGKVWQSRTLAKEFQPMNVVAAGQQVWVGGKAGALFLSRDNGQTWTKISLTGDDIIPLGDVTEIKIANPLLVDVILSSGDDWQTNDGGKSFRLLPPKP